MQEQVAEAVALPGTKPSYFNTGCCSFSDRSITGIEIAGGEIRLVRWEVFVQPIRTVLCSQLRCARCWLRLRSKTSRSLRRSCLL